jgi:phenylacetic acid degradation operon negative regulatory protein
MSVASAAQTLVDEFQSRPTLRAGSLITTVFGDAIAPRGGSIWLGSLIRIMREFGINERLVRTSVYRLSRDGWFVVSQVGRRSYYSLSTEGERKFEHATKRIYSEPVTPWSGDWTLILVGELQHEQKEWLRKETAWLGFAAVGKSVLAHPGADAGQLEPILQHSDVAGKVVVMKARTLGAPDQDAMRELVRRSWNLDDIDRRYADFIEHFKPALGAVRRSRKILELNAMQIRTLLIQEYRKALLRDPLLPVPGRICRGGRMAHEQRGDGGRGPAPAVERIL